MGQPDGLTGPLALDQPATGGGSNTTSFNDQTNTPSNSGGGVVVAPPATPSGPNVPPIQTPLPNQPGLVDDLGGVVCDVQQLLLNGCIVDIERLGL